MKVFAVIFAVCVAAVMAAESVVKVDHAGGNFAYTIDQTGAVPHPYVAHTPYAAPVPHHFGVNPVVTPAVGKPVVAYSAGPVPVGNYYGYPYSGYNSPVAYNYPYSPYHVMPFNVKPEKVV